MPNVRSMSRTGVMVRLLASVVALAILLTAQLGKHDDWFPLGMLGQYAQPRDPNGVVVSTYLEAIEHDGDHHRIAMSAVTTGVARVELEVMLPSLREHPELLSPIAERLKQTRPDLDIRELRVGQHSWQFMDGVVPPWPDDVTVAIWEVR